MPNIFTSLADVLSGKKTYIAVAAAYIVWMLQTKYHVDIPQGTAETLLAAAAIFMRQAIAKNTPPAA